MDGSPPSPIRTAHPRVDIGDTLHEGWLAFCRAPWTFTGFAVLLMALQLLLVPLQERLPGAGDGTPLDWLLGLGGVALSLLLNLWGNVGLVRGAARALAGERPRLGLLLRWDGPAMGRLLLAGLALVGVLLLGLVLALSVGVLGAGMLWLVERPLAAIHSAGASLPGLLLGLLALGLLAALVVLVVYLAVNQQVLVQIVLHEQLGPVASIRRGRELVDPQWILMLILGVIETALLLLGVLTMVVGVLVAWPVVTCITTAAYRQLLLVSATKPSTPTIANSN
ncbi:MAG: hypothetical protein VKO00_01380 [Cyanobacteriota bacterium]|jgi:hypothetical protein|nr:hypothetical protein [Cyanobacteriota bacterium]